LPPTLGRAQLPSTHVSKRQHQVLQRRFVVLRFLWRSLQAPAAHLAACVQSRNKALGPPSASPASRAGLRLAHRHRIHLASFHAIIDLQPSCSHDGSR
ncbi:hypothetical protein CERSUDRAFT_124648, partial [Gelatoporia subvermispora B]